MLLALLLGGLAGAAFGQSTRTATRPRHPSHLRDLESAHRQPRGCGQFRHRAGDPRLPGGGAARRRVAGPLRCRRVPTGRCRWWQRLPSSQILQVTVRSEAPQEAADGADAIAAAYLELRAGAAVEPSPSGSLSKGSISRSRSCGPSALHPTTVALIENLQQQRRGAWRRRIMSRAAYVIGARGSPSAPSGPGLLITVAARRDGGAAARCGRGRAARAARSVGAQRARTVSERAGRAAAGRGVGDTAMSSSGCRAGR